MSKSGREHLFATSFLISVATLGAGLAFAQQPETISAARAPTATPIEEEMEDAGEIVVTGTRIRRPEFSGVIPGAQIGAENIEERGFSNAIDILNDIPLVGGGANLLGNNGGQTASLGAAYVDLLDLGTARTLTLVNGRRFVSSNPATIFVAGNETGSQVDVNNIPVSLIDRIDVLTVGGAVAYGSDAIAGVVNYILKDDFEGFDADVQYGTTEEGEGQYTLRGVIGRNFLNDRGNVVVSFEHTYLDPVLAKDRDFRAANPLGITNWANGSRRNPNFRPALIDANANNGAFLNSADDGITGVAYVPVGRNPVISRGGTIFNVLGTGPATGVNQIGPSGNTFTSAATQLVPGVPGTGNPSGANGNPLSTFAPSTLPTGVTAAQVFSTFGVTPPAGLTSAQLNTLAANVLAANRPTPREYWAANPNVPLNAFLGTFIPAIPDIANPDPNTNRFLPRLGVPIRFNAGGNVETFNYSSMRPNQPGVFNAVPGGDGFNPLDNTILRIEQERNILNANGHFDITSNVRFFTENLYNDQIATSVVNAGSGNLATTSTVENSALIMNVNNPFLDDADRQALAAAGITGNFVLSRTNDDIVPNGNPFSGESTTRRHVAGLRGDFEFLSRAFDWEVSATYGLVESTFTSGNIKDVEYALAIDAVRDASGNIVCRAQLNPSAFIGTTPSGIFANVVRTRGADGIMTERVFTPTITAEQISACRPLNVFGVNQFSREAQNYVSAKTTFNSQSEQNFYQGFVSGSLFDLPAGPLGFSLAAESRRESLDYRADELNTLGRTRTAPSSTTVAEVTATEYGIEASLPIFGQDFTLPGFQALELSGGIRWVKLEGEAERFRNIAGQLITPRYEGDTEEITSIAFTWKPTDDLTFRGNSTRSLRQPSIVELFLGGQPFFTNIAGSTDPCDPRAINSGPRPATRRANCIADVIRRGIRPDEASAASFLASFVSDGRAFTGLISGETNLDPEVAESYSLGMVYEPSFVDNLQLSVDYISVRVDDVIGPLLALPAAQACYDSPTFPDPTAQIGVNSCAGLRRTADFQFDNGFVLPFFNLPSTQIYAWNGNVRYAFDVADFVSIFQDTNKDLGRVRVRGLVYHLPAYLNSNSGRFDDKVKTEGTLARPNWEGQININYEIGKFDFGWATNWQDETVVRAAGTPITSETQDIIRYEAYQIHSAAVEYNHNENWSLQLNVNNVFEYTTIGEEGYYNSQYADQLGRTFLLTLRYRN